MSKPWMSRARSVVRSALPAALIAVGCARAGTPADEGAKVVAAAKAASGGAALDAPAGFHETGTFIRDGVSGKYETWADLRALRSVSTHTIGSKTFTGGFDGKNAWSAGPDGVVRMDPSPEGVAAARLGTYLTVFGFFYPDRFPARFESRGRKEAEGASYDVVTATLVDTPPVDLWFDVQTHRLQRLTGSASGTPFTATVHRYGVVDGIQVPFALTQVEGDHKLALVLDSVVYGPAPPEKFIPPAPAPTPASQP